MPTRAVGRVSHLGFDIGFDFGFDLGFHLGFHLGFNSGFDFGFNLGNDIGFELGTVLGLEERPSDRNEASEPVIAVIVAFAQGSLSLTLT